MIYDYGLKDQVYWSQLQELLIDRMIRLQHSFQPLIAQMDYANGTRTGLNYSPISQIQHKFEVSMPVEIHPNEKKLAAQSKKTSPKQGRFSNPRNGSKLKVTLPDGRVFQESEAADTLIKVIEAIGIERVYDLKLSLKEAPNFRLYHYLLSRIKILTRLENISSIPIALLMIK